MLVLTRKKDEGVNLRIPPSDKEQEVLILMVSCQGRARVGIEAPPEVRIRRSEVPDKHACGAEGEEGG